MGKPVKKKMEVKGSAGKPTFYAQKTVMIMDKKPVFEVFRRFGDGPETSVCKIYPDNLTNPTKFYDSDARLVYDSNSNLIEVPGMAVDAVKQKIAELWGPSPQAPPQSPKPATAQAKPQTPTAPPVSPKAPTPKPAPAPAKPQVSPGPPKATTPPQANYQKLYEDTLNQLETIQTDLESADSRAEELESKLAGKTAKVDTLEKRLEEAKKSATGISQKDLEERLAKQREEVVAMYLAITGGNDSRLENGKVEVRLKIKGEGQWVHEGEDGNFYFTTKDGKKFAYKPTTGEYLKAVKNYFRAARDVYAVLGYAEKLSEELKAKEQKIQSLDAACGKNVKIVDGKVKLYVEIDGQKRWIYEKDGKIFYKTGQGKDRKEVAYTPASGAPADLAEKIANLGKVNQKYFKQIRKLTVKNEKLEDLTKDVPQGEISVLESYPLVEKSWMGNPRIYVRTQFEDCLEVIPFVEYKLDGTAEQKFMQRNGIVVRFNEDDIQEIIEEYNRVKENRPEIAHKIKAARAREMPVYWTADVNGVVKEFGSKAELTYNNIVYSVTASGLVDKDQKLVADQNALKLYNLYLFKKAQEPAVQQEQLVVKKGSWLEEAMGITPE